MINQETVGLSINMTFGHTELQSPHCPTYGVGSKGGGTWTRLEISINPKTEKWFST